MTTQNKDIINKLVGSHAEDASQSPTATSAEKMIDKKDDVLITSNRVVTIRYKIYFLVLLLIGIFSIYNYVLPSYQRHSGLKLKLIGIESQTSIFKARKKKFDMDSHLIQKIESQEKLIVNYLNTNQWYNALDPVIQNSLWIVKSYLQLSSLYNPKMLVDERTILANMNEFLFKYQDGSKTSNGSINKIEIWEPELFEGNLYYLPVVLDATFKNEKGLLSFIDNVEKHILPDPEYRILYKINEISYDIVKYQEEQDVKLVLSIYYYPETNAIQEKENESKSK